MTVTSEVDLTDLDVFERDDAWRWFDLLRRESPVHWNPEQPPNSGFWSITRYADIVAVNRDSDTFTSTKFVNLEEVDEDQQDIRRSMLECDGLRHRALRKLVQRDFGNHALRRYEDFLRALTVTTVDAALAKGEFDFVKEIAADFPIHVLARMLGVPASDTDKLISWGNQMIGNTDPEYTDVLVNEPASVRYRHLPFRSPAAAEVFEYGRELARQRRGGDGEDLVSRLVNGRPIDGQPLTPHEFDTNFLMLVVSGNETTRHSISHAVLALLRHPEQLALLREHPELLPAAVEEMLRWGSAVYQFRRTATRDVELHGQHIRAGDKVVMWFASGNRDETVFDRPYEFDITRRPNDHLVFGKSGPHFCLGSNLARMEVRLMLETLLPRLDRIEPAGEVTLMRSNFVHGIKRLPVRVTTV